MSNNRRDFLKSGLALAASLPAFVLAQDPAQPEPVVYV
ncbi:MAG: twin-arginine translocation signal domain-containing protein, partial [Blastocatellia bacterium]